MVDYLVDTDVGRQVENRLKGSDAHVPAHFDAEVLSALGRYHRAGRLTDAQGEERVDGGSADAETSPRPAAAGRLAPATQPQTRGRSLHRTRRGH